ncbi:MAG: acyl-CoA dehydratase activase [Lachnospiraceae bacterium]|nr:acyl-CoA dehydratase activase [Lachnospiraceae bacterium]
MSELKGLIDAYGAYRGSSFDERKFRSAFGRKTRENIPHISILGARMGEELYQMVSRSMPCPVKNDSCVGNRTAGEAAPPQGLDFDGLMDWYAAALLGQFPCMRMVDNTGRKQLYNDPALKGIIYHTVKFCDFYSFEYSEIKQKAAVPLLKIESDYTLQSSGQLLTRLEAFAESLSEGDPEHKEKKMNKGYFAGVDSGSTSTDVVILNREKEMIAGIILPTGAGAALGAERALDEALKSAGLTREDIDAVVTTGYGRTAIQFGDKSITEITCHARGAHFLDPEVRTVIDIGGQDSKVIRLDEEGNVVNFVMNDKCAAGTGRFLEMMARTLEMSLDEMSQMGLHHKEDITISSMCTVFAESEVVSLIALNKAPDDIVHGLNKAVAVKTASLLKRVDGQEKYMMTGGVSRNLGLVKTLEEKLGTNLVISESAQLCGALGAALFAMDMVAEQA